jgi:hypothetical protein
MKIIRCSDKGCSDAQEIVDEAPNARSAPSHRPTTAAPCQTTASLSPLPLWASTITISSGTCGGDFLLEFGPRSGERTQEFCRAAKDSQRRQNVKSSLH